MRALFCVALLGLFHTFEPGTAPGTHTDAATAMTLPQPEAPATVQAPLVARHD